MKRLFSLLFIFGGAAIGSAGGPFGILIGGAIGGGLFGLLSGLFEYATTGKIAPPK